MSIPSFDVRGDKKFVSTGPGKEIEINVIADPDPGSCKCGLYWKLIREGKEGDGFYNLVKLDGYAIVEGINHGKPTWNTTLTVLIEGKLWDVYHLVPTPISEDGNGHIFTCYTFRPSCMWCPTHGHVPAPEGSGY